VVRKYEQNRDCSQNIEISLGERRARHGRNI
jgi:hypothetical protein